MKHSRVATPALQKLAEPSIHAKGSSFLGSAAGAEKGRGLCRYHGANGAREGSKDERITANLTTDDISGDNKTTEQGCRAYVRTLCLLLLFLLLPSLNCISRHNPAMLAYLTVCPSHSRPVDTGMPDAAETSSSFTYQAEPRDPNELSCGLHVYTQGKRDRDAGAIARYSCIDS